MHLQKYDNASFSLLLRGALVKSYHTIYCFYQLHITYLLTVKSLEYIILMHNHAMQLNVTVMQWFLIRGNLPSEGKQPFLEG